MASSSREYFYRLVLIVVTLVSLSLVLAGFERATLTTVFLAGMLTSSGISGLLRN